jgi:transposase
MDIHQNARTTPHSRAELVRRVKAGEAAKIVAAGLGVCAKTVRKWVGPYAREGPAGLADRSSRPYRLHRPTAPKVAAQVLELRRQRLLMKHIAAQLTLSSTNDLIQKCVTDVPARSVTYFSSPNTLEGRGTGCARGRSYRGTGHNRV